MTTVDELRVLLKGADTAEGDYDALPAVLRRWLVPERCRGRAPTLRTRRADVARGNRIAKAESYRANMVGSEMEAILDNLRAPGGSS
jgi:hypothetical protein